MRGGRSPGSTAAAGPTAAPAGHGGPVAPACARLGSASSDLPFTSCLDSPGSDSPFRYRPGSQGPIASCAVQVGEEEDGGEGHAQQL